MGKLITTVYLFVILSNAFKKMINLFKAIDDWLKGLNIMNFCLPIDNIHSNGLYM